jgi:hypothetical protein
VSHHLSRLAAVAAGLTLTAGVCSAAEAAVGGATAAHPTAAHPTAATAGHSAGGSLPAGRSFFLITGERLGLGNWGGYFAGTATLGPKPSTVELELSTAVRSRLQPLSTATQTVWTWRSAHEAGATVPAGWDCFGNTIASPGSRDCAAQPMMTLEYAVANEGLNGSVAAGQQKIRVSAGHIQLAAQPKVTGLTMQVSFNGGKTWRTARITGSGGGYEATFSAPAGAMVTMRTSATDAAGGSVTETIDSAYQIAS